MPRRGQVPEQLDIPLVWERERASECTPAKREPVSVLRRPDFPSPAWRGKVFLAAVADFGFALLAAVLAGTVALFVGAALAPVQLAIAGLAGIQVTGTAAVAILWVWRGTPGMLLMGVHFGTALELGRAASVWVLWALSLPLAGLPWLIHRRILERVARAPITGSLPANA